MSGPLPTEGLGVSVLSATQSRIDLGVSMGRHYLTMSIVDLRGLVAMAQKGLKLEAEQDALLKEHLDLRSEVERLRSEALCLDPAGGTPNPATSDPAGAAPYGDALQTWFGLTRASWLTLPRVLLEAMPPIWQERLGVLLHEFSGEFVAFDYQPYVTLKRDGRFVAGPDWLSNYRRPDREAIARLRRGACP